MPNGFFREPDSTVGIGNGKAHGGDLARYQRCVGFRQLHAHAHAVAGGIGAVINQYAFSRQHAAVDQHNFSLWRGPQGGGYTLGNLNLNPETIGIEHPQQRLSRRHAFSGLHQAL